MRISDWSSDVCSSDLLVAVSLGTIFLSLIFFLVPALTFWRSNLLYAMGIAAVAMIALRILLGKTLGSQVFKRRIVVLGAGARAARLKALAATPAAAFVVVGYAALKEAHRPIPTATRRRPIYTHAHT